MSRLLVACIFLVVGCDSSSSPPDAPQNATGGTSSTGGNAGIEGGTGGTAVGSGGSTGGTSSTDPCPGCPVSCQEICATWAGQLMDCEGTTADVDGCIARCSEIRDEAGPCLGSYDDWRRCDVEEAYCDAGFLLAPCDEPYDTWLTCCAEAEDCKPCEKCKEQCLEPAAECFGVCQNDPECNAECEEQFNQCSCACGECGADSCG